MTEQGASTMEAVVTKERPILFSGEMVRAIQSGRKTQTRRIIKGAPLNKEAYLLGLHQASGTWGIHDDVDNDDGVFRFKSPCGGVGDRLWVRENFADTGLASSHNKSRFRYQATDSDNAIEWRGRWKPSIHMPRWASRITLEITSIRVQRLQDISEEDAIAEGYREATHPSAMQSPKAWFQSLWVDIYGHESWHANPWVWAFGVRKI